MSVDRKDEKLVEAELAHGKAISLAIAAAADRGDDTLSGQTKAFHNHTMEQAFCAPVAHKIEVLEHSVKPFEAFAARVNALPKFEPAQLEDAKDASERIAAKVQEMQTALNSRKTVPAVALKREIDGLYDAAMKKFAGKQEAFHYTLHTALDAVKPENNHKHDAYVHRFEPDVTAMLPEPIRPMGKHGRFSLYGLGHDVAPVQDGQASLWGDDVAHSRVQATGAARG